MFISNPCLKNPTDGGAWWATAQRVIKSQTRLSEHTHTPILHLDFISFAQCLFSVPRPHPIYLNYISLSYFLKVLQVVTVSQTFFVFDDLNSFEDWLSILQNTPQLNVDFLFSHDETEVMDVEEEEHRSKVHSCQIIPRASTLSMECL